MRFFETLNYTGLGNRLYWPPSMVTSSLNTEAASIASNPRGLAQDRQQYLVSNPKSLSVEKRTTICEELLKQIYEKAKFLRSLKTSPSSLNSSGDNISSTSSSSSSSSSSSGGVPRAARVPTKSEVIFELLELKYLYCLLNPVPVTDEQLLVDTEVCFLSLSFSLFHCDGFEGTDSVMVVKSSPRRRSRSDGRLWILRQRRRRDCSTSSTTPCAFR